ncbi:MAG: hypothetical protein OXE99_06960 [Cellvibrionales bacterium]|nr:hypothetical protein [Cellvibrionales bacterium]
MKPIIFALSILLMPFSFQQAIAATPLEETKTKPSFDLKQNLIYFTAGGGVLLSSIILVACAFSKPKTNQQAAAPEMPEFLPEKGDITPKQTKETIWTEDFDFDFDTHPKPLVVKQQILEESKKLYLDEKIREALEDYKPNMATAFSKGIAIKYKDSINIPTDHAGTVKLDTLKLTPHECIKGRPARSSTAFNLNLGIPAKPAIEESKNPEFTIVTADQITKGVYDFITQEKKSTFGSDELAQILVQGGMSKEDAATKIEELRILKQFAANNSMGDKDKEDTYNLFPLMFPAAQSGPYSIDPDLMNLSEGEQKPDLSIGKLYALQEVDRLIFERAQQDNRNFGGA